MQTVLERAVARGEIDAIVSALAPHRSPLDLVRHDVIMSQSALVPRGSHLGSYIETSGRPIQCGQSASR